MNTSTELNLINTYKESFANAVQKTITYHKYSKTKIKEKSRGWNNVGLQMLATVKNDYLKTIIASEFAKYMIEKSLQIGNEYPYLHPEFENSFIKRSIESI